MYMKKMKNRKPLDISIGKQLKKARDDAGYTQEGFAELIGMSAQNLSDVERGMTGISVLMLKTICKTLYISSDLLIMDEAVKIIDDGELIFLIERLKRLSPRQRKVALSVNNNLFEAFALSEMDDELTLAMKS
jgi:transcriptional regulator with XRE-family HTH domain